MTPATISVKDLPPDVRKKLAVRTPRRKGMSKDDVRTAAIRVLAVVADLSQSERARVLRHALEVNKV